VVRPEGLTHPVGGVTTELVDDVLVAVEHPGLGPAVMSMTVRALTP
jgi:hypothetical protein